MTQVVLVFQKGKGAKVSSLLRVTKSKKSTNLCDSYRPEGVCSCGQTDFWTVVIMSRQKFFSRQKSARAQKPAAVLKIHSTFAFSYQIFCSFCHDLTACPYFLPHIMLKPALVKNTTKKSIRTTIFRKFGRL